MLLADNPTYPNRLADDPAGARRPVLPRRPGGAERGTDRGAGGHTVRRPAMASASPRNSAPSCPPPASAWSRVWPSGSTARPTRARAAPARRRLAVVAGGLDRPYPRRHTRLWERVAEHGVIVSESPAGVRTEKWRFPVRNRLLAALSDVVVVVESRHHGGSRHTVDAATARGVPVGAVPGSIRSADIRGHERAAGRRRVPGVLGRRHPCRAVAGRRDRAEPSGSPNRVLVDRPPTRSNGGAPDRLRGIDPRPDVAGRAGPGHRARRSRPLRRLWSGWPRPAWPTTPGDGGSGPDGR